MNSSRQDSSRFKKFLISISVVAVASFAVAQTRPTTQDVQGQFDRLIGTGNEPAPLKPQPSPVFDTSSSIAPGAPRQTLKREGTELYYEATVSIAQAALGTRIIVPTVDSDEEVEIKAGTQPYT